MVGDASGLAMLVFGVGRSQDVKFGLSSNHDSAKLDTEDRQRNVIVTAAPPTQLLAAAPAPTLIETHQPTANVESSTAALDGSASQTTNTRNGSKIDTSPI